MNVLCLQDDNSKPLTIPKTTYLHVVAARCYLDLILKIHKQIVGV